MVCRVFCRVFFFRLFYRFFFFLRVFVIFVWCVWPLTVRGVGCVFFLFFTVRICGVLVFCLCVWSAVCVLCTSMFFRCLVYTKYCFVLLAFVFALLLS